MPSPLPQDKYLFAKLDTGFCFVYVNRFFIDFFSVSKKSFIGKPMLNARNAARPLCVYEKAINQVKQKGFATCIAPHLSNTGEIAWGCVDLSRRFGASADSGMIGYEFVSYPASQAAINFFEPVYKELARLEQQHPDDSNIALAHLEECVAATGKPYDELVHTLQNS